LAPYSGSGVDFNEKLEEFFWLFKYQNRINTSPS